MIEAQQGIVGIDETVIIFVDIKPHGHACQTAFSRRIKNAVFVIVDKNRPIDHIARLGQAGDGLVVGATAEGADLRGVARADINRPEAIR